VRLEQFWDFGWDDAKPIDEVDRGRVWKSGGLLIYFRPRFPAGGQGIALLMTPITVAAISCDGLANACGRGIVSLLLQWHHVRKQCEKKLLSVPLLLSWRLLGQLHY
jgi:hypothetical protein